MKRSGPIKRKTPMRQRRRESADIEREPHPVALAPSVALRRGTYAGTTTGLAVPKGPATKPGKGAQTKDESAWITALLEHGCICCRMLGHGYSYPEIHHILSGGRRMGHKFTLPLCYIHHRGGSEFNSRHPWKERFIAAYGEEMALLATLQGVLKLQPDGSYATCE